MRNKGTVYADITLKNSADLVRVSDGTIKPEQARTATVTAVADTKALHPVITEELCEKLGLGIEKDGTARIANGQTVPCKLTKAVRIEWKDRSTISNAVVIPGAERVLLGIIAMEGMDLMVDPTTRQLVGAHGDKPEFLAL